MASSLAVLHDSEYRTRYFSYLYATILVFLLTLYSAFTDVGTVGDEQGLYNAIYMYEQTGKVTYPMQGQWDFMTIHPPWHYFVVGFLKSHLGLNLFHAAAIPLVLLAIIVAVVTVRSSFSDSAKVSVLGGFTLAVLVYLPIAIIRPELHIAFAWFAGLVLLESARGDDWDHWKLFLGGFFTAYATGLHYWVAPAVLALLVYLALLWKTQERRRSLRQSAYLLSGGLLFYIPYLIFFIIPEYGHIIAMLRAADATGGGISQSLESYHRNIFSENNVVNAWIPGLRWLGKAFYLPLKAGIPLILVAAPIVFLSRSLRVMGAAGSLLPLFVVFGVSRKAGLFYVGPELVLFCVAFCLLLCFFLTKVWRLAGGRGRTAPLAAAALAVVVLGIVNGPWRTEQLTWERTQWEVARAANAEIVGPNANVAINNVYQWYYTGASRLCWLTRWGLDWEAMRACSLDQFDSYAFVDDWFGNQPEAVPFPWYYLDRKLHLLGFYTETNSAIRMHLFHLTASSSRSRVGFVYDRRSSTLRRFAEDPAGNWVFVMLLGLPDAAEFEDAEAWNLIRIRNPAEETPQLHAVLMQYEKWRQKAAGLASKFQIRDELRLTSRVEDTVELRRRNDNRFPLFPRADWDKAASCPPRPADAAQADGMIQPPG